MFILCLFFPVDVACGHLYYYGVAGDTIVFIKTVTNLEREEVIIMRKISLCLLSTNNFQFHFLCFGFS